MAYFDRRYLRLEYGILVLLVLGYGALILLDPFLITWDEQYHALVAKNLMSHPFKPTLLEHPVLPFVATNWTANHVWLHKQPLFLWQIALSLKLFGFHAWAVRLPSVLMHLGTVLCLFSMGKKVFTYPQALLGALCIGLAFYPLETMVGHFATDHNDTAFAFYVFASLWALFNYLESGARKWIFWIGILSGAAILVKWLVGLLVFAVWGLIILKKCFSKPHNPHSNSTTKSILSRFKPMLIPLSITTLVAVPWQLYILSRFPVESRLEYALNTAHFWEAVEGHGGPWYYHFTEGLHRLYGAGDLVPWLVVLAFVWMVWTCPNRNFKQIALFSVILVYSFYSLAATKMPGFTLIVAPFFCMAVGVVVSRLISWMTGKLQQMRLKNSVRVILSLALLALIMNPRKLYHNHRMWKPHDNSNRAMELLEMEFIRSVNDQLPTQEHYVIFNNTITLNGHIPMMFFTDHIAYDVLPVKAVVDSLKSSGHPIAIVEWGEVPAEILNDSSIVKLKVPKVD